MEEYLNYNIKKINKKHKSRRTSPRKINSSFKNNILQFSLNAINDILINNLNSSINLGMINITNNNIPKKKNQIMNNNLYINSIYDSIDYKIKGNIYKTSKENFFYLYPNMENIIRNKSSKKREIKILKFNKEILTPQNKTPVKEGTQHFYFNLIKNNNHNDSIPNNTPDNFRHSQKNNYIGDLDHKDRKMNNKTYYIYRTSTTINSKEKNKDNINSNSNTYLKKISPIKKYSLNRTNIISKENNIENQNKYINKYPKRISPNINKKKYLIKIIGNMPKKKIIYSKNKNTEKTKIVDSKRNNNAHNDLKNEENYELYNKSPNYNSLTYTNDIKKTNIKNRNVIKIQNNNYKSPKIEKNFEFSKNKNILYINNVNKNQLLLTPNRYKEARTENNINNFNNKNLNIPYNPTISNSLNKLSSRHTSPKNKDNLYIQTKSNINNDNIIKKNVNNYNTINNDNDIKNKNDYSCRKVQTFNNKGINFITLEANDYGKKNNVFNNDDNKIFKVLDNTQIITDECGSIKSSENSNKLHQYSVSNSNGTNTNQDTDYNSIKKYNNNVFANESDNNNYFSNNQMNNEYKNIEENFSFNNL